MEDEVVPSVGLGRQNSNENEFSVWNFAFGSILLEASCAPIVHPHQTKLWWKMKIQSLHTVVTEWSFCRIHWDECSLASSFNIFEHSKPITHAALYFLSCEKAMHPNKTGQVTDRIAMHPENVEYYFQIIPASSCLQEKMTEALQNWITNRLYLFVKDIA